MKKIRQQAVQQLPNNITRCWNLWDDGTTEFSDSKYSMSDFSFTSLSVKAVPPRGLKWIRTTGAHEVMPEPSCCDDGLPIPSIYGMPIDDEGAIARLKAISDNTPIGETFVSCLISFYKISRARGLNVLASYEKALTQGIAHE